MLQVEERRRDKRVRFSWPLWFGYSENGQLHQAKVMDLSRSGVGFAVDEQCCPEIGQHVLTRFSYPSDLNGSFNIDSYYHWAEVIRVDTLRPGRNRVALRLHKQLASEPEEIIPTGQ